MGHRGIVNVSRLTNLNRVQTPDISNLYVKKGPGFVGESCFSTSYQGRIVIPTVPVVCWRLTFNPATNQTGSTLSILRTTDGGLSWQPVVTEFIGASVMAVGHRKAFERPKGAAKELSSSKREGTHQKGFFSSNLKSPTQISHTWDAPSCKMIEHQPGFSRGSVRSVCED